MAVVDEVLGPGNPDEWEDFRDCVRAKVGGDDEFNLLHCGVTEEHATEVIEIMEDIHTRKATMLRSAAFASHYYAHPLTRTETEHNNRTPSLV